MPYARTLALSHLCAVLVAVLGLSLLGGCDNQASTTPPRRFEVHAVQTSQGPILVRFDTATGELTQSSLADGRIWTPLGTQPRSRAGEHRAGRYALDYVQSPSIPLTFIRVDGETGAVWRLSHPGDRDWTAVHSAAAGPEADGTAPTAVAAPEPQSVASDAVARLASASRPESSAGSERVGRRPTKTDVDAFVEAVTSMDLPSDMRSWAVEQLGHGPTEHAVGPLVDLLADADPVVVRTAARALAGHDDPRVRPALEQLAQHEAPDVRRVAERALSSLR